MTRTASNEIRENIITNRWVMFAPNRAERPVGVEKCDAGFEQAPEHDDSCPFCPGNEEKISDIKLEMPHGGDLPWGTRMIANEYPILSPGKSDRRYQSGMHVAMAGVGDHQVIVESPIHNRHLGRMSQKEATLLIETYHRGLKQLKSLQPQMTAFIFKNYGPRAGNSLVHPHSQIVLSPISPVDIRLKEQQALEYYNRWGRCLCCDVLESELRDGRRIVTRNDSFVALVPYAARVPCEIWIFPTRHCSDFEYVSEDEKPQLARILRKVLGLFYDKLENPDYNYFLSSSPSCGMNEPRIHWFLEIRPRLSPLIGFEIGSGIHINPSLPEKDAAFLRE